MSEFKNPGQDMSRAIISSGLFCIFCFMLIPFVFQGVLGTKYMLNPDVIYAGAAGPGVGSMVQGGHFMTNVIIVLLFFTVIVAIMTAMSGSSRTLFQGGQDGWLPKYLSHLKTTRCRPTPCGRTSSSTSSCC